MFYQMLVLNVVVNSFSGAILTLLVSNQFIELKTNVFKRFGPHNILSLGFAGAPFH